MSEFKYIRRFGLNVDAGVVDKMELGGKGAGLAEMGKLGFPIPPGFTIVTQCCRQFMASGRWPDGLRDEIDAAMMWLEQTTGRAYAKGAQPLLVSVRSGAPVSMPGMMDTLLNCGLNPSEPHGADARFGEIYGAFRERFSKQSDVAIPDDPRELLHACIENVWRSWLSPRAVTYRRSQHIDDTLGTAVNVQSMFSSQVSGVVFTVDPNAPDGDEMIVEASYGLGESVVSGEVTPDLYRVSREDGSLRRSVVGHKASAIRALGDTTQYAPDHPCLNAAQLAELAKLCLRIAKMRGAEMDVEFGWADGAFAILQSRSIRGIDVYRDVERGRVAMVEGLRERCVQRRMWIRHNLDETLSHPTPMTWSIVSRFMTGQGGFGRMYRDFGYRPDAQFMAVGFLDCIGGRIYADTERAAGLFYDGMPLAYDLEALRHDPKRIDQPPTVFKPEQSDSRFLGKLPANVWAMIRASRRMKRLGISTKAVFREEVLPSFLAWIESERARNLDELGAEALVATIRERVGRVMDDFAGESLKPGFFGSLAQGRLTADLVMALGQERGQELALRLIMGLDDDMTMEQNALLVEVAHGRVDLGDYVARYGHRTLGEMELALPRWREDASYIERMVPSLKKQELDPHERHRTNVRQREAAESELFASLAALGASSLRERINKNLRAAQSLLPWRENGKHYLMLGYELIRQALLALGRRCELGSDIFYLKLSELDDVAGARAHIAERKIRRESQKRLDMPTVIDSDDLATLGLPRQVQCANELKGDAISAGLFTGRARIIFDPSETRELGDDAVLVCPSTDPAWAALFAQVKGMVIERGGMLSHGAIVARDFGLPAVVLPDATRLIAEGQYITVNGNTGQITLQEIET